jgi:hypothetical protein
VRFRKLLAVNNDVQIDSLFVGPQSLGTGFAGTDWQSVSMVSSGFGTTTLDSFWRRQVGDTAHYRGYFKAGTVSANIASINLPTGDVIDSSKYSSATSVQLIGHARQIRNGALGTDVLFEVMYDGATTNAVFFTYQSASNVFTKVNGNTVIGNSDGFSFEFSVPLTRATSNVTMADRQIEEYASNNGASTTLDDTTSFVNGPYGAQIVAFTTGVQRRVRFQSPILPTDSLTLEFFNNGTWNPHPSAVIVTNFRTESTNTYGASINNISGLPSTDVQVTFGAFRVTTNSYGAAGTTWAGIAGTDAYRWRVRKVSGGASVGYPIAPGNITLINSADNYSGNTKLGLMQYQHGTTYNGGNAPTVTLFSGGGTLDTISIAKFIPYQMADGIWRMKFNIRVILNAQSRTITALNINGVSFPAVDQAVAGNNAGAAPASYVVATASTSRVTMGFSSAVTDSTMFSGDVELASKPTWAY